MTAGHFPLFRSLARTQVQYGLVVEIGDEAGKSEDTLKGAKLQVMRWVYQRVNVVAPPYIDLTASFENNDTPGVKFGLAADGNAWVARMERADNAVHGRHWTTEINVSVEGESAWLAVRNFCTSEPQVTEPVPISTPNFVRFFADRIGLLDAEVEIAEKPWLIEDETDLEDLGQLLVNPNRFLPIVLLTEPYAIPDVDTFARRAVGVAHIVMMPDKFTRAWGETVGKEMGAFFGAVRTYYPGLDLGSDSPFDHPLALRRRIQDFVAPNGQTGPVGFVEYLLQKCYSSGATKMSRDERYPRFSAVRAATAMKERQDARPSADDQALLAYAGAQIDEAKQMEKFALDENKRLEGELRDAQGEAHSLAARVEHLTSVLKASGKSEDIPIETKLSELRTWADKYISDRVHITPRAYRGAKDSEYEHPQHVYQALKWFAVEYHAAKDAENEDDPRRVAMVEKLRELGMEYSGSIARERATDQYFIDYNGERRFINMHIKKGTSWEGRYCMRIYTFWDDETERTVVGWMTSHLDNSLT